MLQQEIDQPIIGAWGPAESRSSSPGAEPAVEQIARFVSGADFASIGGDTKLALKRTVLDTIACAVAALGGEPAKMLREQFREYGGNALCTLIGGGRTSPDQAALLNSVLVRYVDILDTYMSPGGLCHPSDNFGAVLAAAEMSNRSGRDFLLALAIAYEVQCRFTEVVPVMFRGLNHALQLSMSVAAAASRLLDLTPDQTANAIAIAAADNVSLAVVHVEPVSHWKGISPGWTGMRALYGTSMAKKGFTGPLGLFEGPNGLNRLFDQTISIDWTNPALGASRKTVFKKYSALVHGQPVIETALALRSQHRINPEDVAEVIAEVFHFAYEIAGGGHFGNKDRPQTKEQADYNLKYLIAAALLDGEVGPAQLEADRILRRGAQQLLQRVTVKPCDEFTRRYPNNWGAGSRSSFATKRRSRASRQTLRALRHNRSHGKGSWRNFIGCASRLPATCSETRSCPRSRISTKSRQPNLRRFWAVFVRRRFSPGLGNRSSLGEGVEPKILIGYQRMDRNR